MTGTPHIVHEIFDIFYKAPGYSVALEIALLVLVIWLIFHKRKSNEKSRLLSEEEKAAIIAKWTPEPLIGDVSPDNRILFPKLVTSRVGKRITIEGHNCLNLATHNYLGLLEDMSIHDEAIKSVKKYGVGSCGPRGFYGTLDVHLELEERIAKFMKLEEAIVYSYGFSTIASCIAAYSKRNDICFVDEQANFSIQKGLDASRCKVIYFKHNDMEDLERHLIEHGILANKNPKKALKTRKFLIVEGIYMNTGEICNLPKLVELRKKYKLRLFIDESISFGTLGSCGRGVSEHFNIARDEIDIISAGMEGAMASIGGFCVGSSFIIDHQRLSGLGYCFSASLPPLLTQAAICALDKFEENTEMFHELEIASRKLHEKMDKLSFFKLQGNILSPVKHLYLKNELDFDAEKNIINIILNMCIKNGLCLTNAEYLEHMEVKCPRPSIRITANRLLTDDDINFAFNTLENATKNVT